MPKGHTKYPYTELGLKLRKLRGNATQAIFAESLGVALRTYIRYESGERKVPDGLLRLAEILDEQKQISGRSWDFDEFELDQKTIYPLMDRLHIIIDEFIDETKVYFPAGTKSLLVMKIVREMSNFEPITGKKETE